MRRGTWVAAATGLLALLVSSLASAAATPRRDFTEPSSVQTQSDYYIVVFKDPPAARYAGGIKDLKSTKPAKGEKLNARSAAVRAYADHLKSVHANYRAFLNGKAAGAEIVDEYELAANAVAVKANGANAETLKKGPGVQSVDASWLYRPAMNASVDVIHASDVWPSQGGRSDAGSGIKVGIIDTGIDDSHDFFQCKTITHHGPYASGNAFRDPSNDIVFDHGTHVAGTVGGCVITLTSGPITGPISGVAPGAELHDYNVFPGWSPEFIRDGDAFSHDICHAIEDAVADGMDVINMSLGGKVQGPHDFLAECTQGAVDAGVVAAVAAGNSGPGDMTAESPGSAAGALTAGATTNSHLVGILAALTSASGTDDYLAAAGDFDPFAATMATGQAVVDWADTGGAVTACSAPPTPAAAAGKIVLISRGACTFTTKVRNAQNAGAFGVIVYNNVAGPAVAMGADGTTPEPTIPAVMISQADGADALSKLPSTAAIDGTNPQEFAADPDILAGFSSRGPTPFTYLIKPDVTAPGVNVYSSVFDNEFAMFQGTSMATPHLAGSAALLLKAHPDWSPADVKSAMVNTADRPATLSGLSPLARGGGRVNVASAIAATATVDPASVSFGFWNGNKPVESSVDLTVSGSSCGAPSVSGTPGVTVTVTGSAPGTLTATLSGGRTAASGDYYGDIELTCTGTTLRIPWWTRIDRNGKP